MSVLRVSDPEFEYSEECYQYLLKRERKRPQFHNRSPQLEYREQLIKRIHVLCIVYKLSIGVKYLSVYIMDFFMDNYDICEERLELASASSLLIAAKVDENDNKIPKISQLVSDPNQYLSCEAKDMESKILQFFNWVFLTPTAATYIEYFYIKCIPETQINNKSRALVDKYLDNSLETRFYAFYPSLIAASVIYCVRRQLGVDPFWSLTAQTVTKYSFSQIHSCVYELRKYEIMSPLMSPPKRFRISTDNQMNAKVEDNDSGIFDCDN